MIRDFAEDDQLGPIVPDSKQCLDKKRFLSCLGKATVTLLCLWGVIDLVFRGLSLSATSLVVTPPNLCYCGNTLVEAHALGCEYVAMASAYLPAHCRDPALESDFETIGPSSRGAWSYHADESLTQSLTSAEIARFAGSTTKYYTSWEWHVLHCLFYWRKMHRAQFLGTVIEPRFNTDNHIHHCTKLILNGDRNGSTTSGIDMGDGAVSEAQQQARVLWTDLRDGLV